MPSRVYRLRHVLRRLRVRVRNLFNRHCRTGAPRESRHQPPPPLSSSSDESIVQPLRFGHRTDRRIWFEAQKERKVVRFSEVVDVIVTRMGEEEGGWREVGEGKKDEGKGKGKEEVEEEMGLDKEVGEMVLGFWGADGDDITICEDEGKAKGEGEDETAKNGAAKG